MRGPYHVEPFSGYPIRPDLHRTRWDRPITDWHVVDERGRTVRVYPHRDGGSNYARRRGYAEACAARLNARVAP